MNRKSEIYLILTKLSASFKETPEPDYLQAISCDLEEYSIEAIKASCDIVKKTCKFFPSLSEIVKNIEPVIEEIDIANEKANKILYAAANYSQYDKVGPKEFLGDLWPIADTFGFAGLTMITNDDLKIVRAQLRGHCKSYDARIKSNLTLIDMEKVREMQALNDREKNG